MTRLLKLTILTLSAFVFMNCSSNDDTNTQQEPTTVTDADGNVYQTIVIGNQTWMLENLKTTKYNDGTPLTEWVFGMDWGSLPNQEELYQWANTTDLNAIVNAELPFDYYGAMYNHFAIETGKLAPEGWRIPSEQDFIVLESYLNANGYSGNVATALKSDSGWSDFSGNGSDAIGFKGLPNGYIAAGGTATASESVCTWLTSDVASGPINSSTTRRWVQLFDGPTLFYSDTSITLGAAIRCIKNN
ncbi:FISUMP domain-containing protein [Winogradskyella sp. UBA3174]|uniref:FISUMP domain-containing protein n=1 Tax=Winogradskyella sp. UBA3174 TaxID=1947785 RepID=UPI0025E47CDD|nr:FISUMP domain-containing protein [Winogradskyella sp. UBA3174]|tara:strand:- start:39074 stop:39808 length:735 start_codon:yes stop_codon:yes gene_type:complete